MTSLFGVEPPGTAGESGIEGLAWWRVRVSERVTMIPKCFVEVMGESVRLAEWYLYATSEVE